MEKGEHGEVEVADLPLEAATVSEELTRVKSAEPSDGGTRAWLQVMGSVFTLFNVW